MPHNVPTLCLGESSHSVSSLTVRTQPSVEYTSDLVECSRVKLIIIPFSEKESYDLMEYH